MIITKVMSSCCVRLSNLELGMLVHTYNLSNWEVETRGFGVQGHEKLHREFETSLCLYKVLSGWVVVAHAFDPSTEG